MAVLNDGDYQLFQAPSPDFRKLDNETLKVFFENGFIIDDDRDELAEIKHYIS